MTEAATTPKLPFSHDRRAQAAVLADLPDSVAQEAGEFYEAFGAAHDYDLTKRECMAEAWRGVLRPYLIGLRDHYQPQARPEAAFEDHERLTAEARESVAAFMIRNSFATGHGDTLDDLLGELDAQVQERASAQERLMETLIEALEDAREKMWAYGFSEDDLRPIRKTIEQADTALAQARKEQP